MEEAEEEEAALLDEGIAPDEVELVGDEVDEDEAFEEEEDGDA